MEAITADLAAEHEALDVVVRDRPDADWAVPTPAPGWAVRDQIAHLWYFDGTAVLAATDPEAFKATTTALLAAGPDAALEPSRRLRPAELLTAWRQGRAELLEVLARLDPSARIPWYGPAMAARSFATARLMETWAHGQDVVDALGVTREPTDRLRHVAHIGVRARPFSYAVRGLEVPAGEVHVALDPPGGGERWTWNNPASPDRVTGPALDFCLVVTQRRHPADTTLAVEGPLATDWIAIAQAFAGPPGEGRRPGQFAT
ncbi:MAG TPA: TIGR03084 family metal-binding protein [Acidimicrobiales bacterium]